LQQMVRTQIALDAFFSPFQAQSYMPCWVV